MSAAAPPAFSRAGALALVAGGAALFLLMVWLIGSGSSVVNEGRAGEGHAAARGLNGYAGLVRLVEAQGRQVMRARSEAALDNYGLLVLTPPSFPDSTRLARVLAQRAAARQPTLVILPKWAAAPPPPDLPPAARAKFKRGWVVLEGARALTWPADLPAPFTLTHARAEVPPGEAPRWEGLGLAGQLPTREVLHFDKPSAKVLIRDGAGRALAVEWPGERVVFVADPDLLNNYGLADRARAALAVALIARLAAGAGEGPVIFDLTLNGFGGQENLLTLALRPPFLAATLCLLLALVLVGWRAFLRFGPPAAPAGPPIAFGKQQLIANSAGLILRARRFGLLAAPYGALVARRLAERLGLARAEPGAIDAALARRRAAGAGAGDAFSTRAARLAAARRPAEILAAAQALDQLVTQCQQGHPHP